MTLYITSSTLPTYYTYTTPPDNDIPDINKGQLLIDLSDEDEDSSALYIMKDGSVGSQNWLRLATHNQLQAAIPARSASPASRSLDTSFQISTTRDCLVNYSVDVQTAISLISGQAGTIYLEIADDTSFTSGVQEVGRFLNSCTGTLTIGLNLNQVVTGTLSGFIPSGKYVRLRTENNVGSPTFTYRSGQEVLM